MSTGPAHGREQRDDGTFADVLNGFTLDSGRGRRKRKKDKDGHAHAQSPDAPTAETRGDPMTPPPAPVADILAPHHPLFDTGAQRHGHHSAPAYRPPPVPEPPSALEETAIVRPYALTGGRTKANRALELETLISTNAEELTSFVPEQIEQTSIVEECRTPRSVAEIASALRVPLGVARVLISDAADAGLVIVHKTASGGDNDEAHLILMERVLSGLRRL
ncbi:DUF742 domain-containing protein [Amycolatopsis magusensis]|uniref:DUF742 domain-containing protein n=1 Tax=Amycolatopsis magusensis TaxID=882444 RepID=UPI00379A9876